MNKRYRLYRYASMLLATVFIMTSLSCERELFWVYDADEVNAKHVSLTLGFEVPRYGNEAVTRNLSANDEHKINNFQLLIFQCVNDGEGQPDPSQSYCIYNRFYSPSELADKTDFQGEEDTWVSVETKYNDLLGGAGAESINSSSGYMIIDDLEIDTSKGCYIFGFANVEDVDGELQSIAAVAYDKGGTKYTTTRAALNAIKVKEGASNDFGTLQDLQKIQVELNNLADHKNDDGLLEESILNREYANLLYSGAWSKWTKKITGSDGTQHNFYDDDNLNGYVSPETFGAVQSGNSIDLRSKGMIYLRALISHVKFIVTYDEDMFKDFKPESWEVVHVPVRSYFLDRSSSDSYAPLSSEVAFGRLEPIKKMTHTEGHYEFDFYMYENHKNASDIDDIDVSDKETFTNADKALTEAYYTRFYGDGINKIPGVTPPVDPNQLYYAVYGYGYDPEHPNSDESKKAKTSFLYAKRELELKGTGGVSDSQYQNKVIWNIKGEQNSHHETNGYDSKKFVYSEPKSTYVIIKGRLQLNTENQIKLKNLAGFAEYDDATGAITNITATNIDDVTDGYADVTYTIHLGYVGQKDAGGNVTLEQVEDFNVLRNTDYTYNVHIAGINSILTSVIADLDVNVKNPSLGKYRVKYQPGADGHLNLAMGTIYNMDAHYNQFNFMLTKSSLSDFYFEMHTPWNTITSVEVKEAIRQIKGLYGFWPNPQDSTQVDMEAYNLFSRSYDGIIRNALYEPTGEINNAVKTIYDKFALNQDFTWFKFTPTTDQRGLFDTDLQYSSNQENYAKNRATTYYDPNSATLWNLFQFMVTMDALSMSSSGIPDYKETGTQIHARIAETMYGEGGVKAGSTSVFTCNVNGVDYSGDYALPFLTDIRTYELEEIEVNGQTITPIQQYGWILSNYETYGNIPFDINNPNSFYRYKRPYISDGKYMVEENYIQYLRDTEPNCFGVNAGVHELTNDKKIHRMFYTGYVDEYFYSQPPLNLNGVTISWGTPYWTEFVNKPARYISFGYRASDGSGTAGYTQKSLDGESSLMTTQLTMVQSSIQTFYKTTGNPTYALGLEHENETHDPRWQDSGGDELPTSKLSSADGYANTYPHVVGLSWDTYVSEKVWETPGDGIDGAYYHNVSLKRANSNSLSESDREQFGNAAEVYTYVAGAIRMCLNRNRDEDGDGTIDASEVKWYLPASTQLDLASMCHFSLSDPLFNYNDFYDSKVTDAENHQRLPKNEFSKLNSQYLYKFHYVASDYMVSLAEEMMNSSPYNNTYTSKPYELRCVRNLNYDPTVNSTPGAKITVYSNTDVVSNSKYRTADDVKVYSFSDTGDHIFEMNKLDSRSIRSTIYHSRELPSPHYLFSATNLPYDRFQVAKDNDILEDIFIDPGPTYNKQELNNITLEHPCSLYYEDDTEDEHGNPTPKDLGAWRAPNFTEVGLMMVELRARNPEVNGNVPDNNANPLFFWKSTQTSYQPFSATSWNFTGPWGRVMGVKWSSGGWDTYSSDPKSWDNKNVIEEWQYSKTKATGFFLRCVKDLPKNN